MKQNKTKQMTAEQLQRRYEEIGLEQDGAILNNENAKFKKLFEEMESIEAELKARGQRQTLMEFYDHPNMQVRLNAAKATLAIAPIEARRQLEAIKASRHFPQAGDAGMSLRNLERGIFKPE